MRLAVGTSVAFAVALVVTNSFWFYKSIDVGVSLTHQGVSLEDNRIALDHGPALVRS